MFDDEDDGDGKMSAGELNKVYDRMIKHLIGEMTFALMTFLFIIFVVIMPLCTHYHFLRPTADPPWTPVEAFYWSIITFSTIGLGDYVPMTGTPASLWGDFLNGSQFWYIFLGLILLAAILNEAQEHCRLSSVFALLLVVPGIMAEMVTIEGCSSCAHCPCRRPNAEQVRQRARERGDQFGAVHGAVVSATELPPHVEPE